MLSFSTFEKSTKFCIRFQVQMSRPVELLEPITSRYEAVKYCVGIATGATVAGTVGAVVVMGLVRGSDVVGFAEGANVKGLPKAGSTVEEDSVTGAEEKKMYDQINECKNK